MQIDYRSPYNFRHHFEWRTCKIEDYVQASLEDRDSDGQLERAQCTAAMATAALGRLVQLLASRGQLTAQDVALIAGASTDEVRFTQ